MSCYGTRSNIYSDASRSDSLSAASKIIRPCDIGPFNSRRPTVSSSGVVPISVQHVNSPVRYSQQLACELETKEESAVEVKGHDNPSLFTSGQPEIVLRTFPQQDSKISRKVSWGHNKSPAATNGKQPESRFQNSFGKTDWKREGQQPQKTTTLAPEEGFCKGFGMANGIKSDAEEMNGTKETIEVHVAIKPQHRVDHRSDKSLNDFIARVIIPPPPPSFSSTPVIIPLPEDLEVEKSRFFSRKIHIQPSSPLDIRYECTSPAESAKAALPSPRNQVIANKTTRDQVPPESRVQLEKDFALLVTPPPPPPPPQVVVRNFRGILKSDSSKSVEGMFIDTDTGRGLLTVPSRTTISTQRPTANPPPPTTLPPPSPAFVHQNSPNLPPIYPKRPPSAGRSPNVNPRPLISVAPDEKSPPRSPPTESPCWHKVPTGFKDDLSAILTSKTPVKVDDVQLIKRKMESNTRGLNGQDGMMPIDLTSQSVPKHRNLKCSSTVFAETSKTLAHSRVHNSMGTLPRTKPPVPPPRTDSSVENSPMIKRSTRRVSFDVCPSSEDSRSVKCQPIDDSQSSAEEKRNSCQMEANPPQSSALSRLINVATNWVGCQRQAPPTTTAQIRPSAIRSSSSAAFHSMVQDDEVFNMAAARNLGRSRRSGSVGEASTKTNTSILSNLRSKFKAWHWSPSMTKRKSSLQDSDQSSIKSTSSGTFVKPVDYALECVDGNPNTRKKGRSSKNRSTIVDIKSLLGRRNVEDEQTDYFQDQRPSDRNTFKTFNGQLT